jgi:hypothetical protein
MSFYSYKASQLLSAEDAPFDAYIMAAMRKADTFNLINLKAAFPNIWGELQARYNAPGGFINGETPEKS